ncbi:MAG: type II toxin-antitoxin system VapC family toxin [Anaerolineae bacterium]
MNVVDSSGWLEYFADGPNAAFFAPAIEDPDALLVPSLSLFEVFKKVFQERGESEALGAIAIMKLGRVVLLDDATALAAAHLSVDLGLPMADSIMLATARDREATFWTQDADFRDMEDVQYAERKAG